MSTFPHAGILEHVHHLSDALLSVRRRGHQAIERRNPPLSKHSPLQTNGIDACEKFSLRGEMTGKKAIEKGKGHAEKTLVLYPKMTGYGQLAQLVRAPH